MMEDGRIMRRELLDDASLKPSEDNKRIEGTVAHVPMPWIEYADDEDDDSGHHPGYWYVEDGATGLRYSFDNAIAHNPYRGLGSQSCTYVFAKDDAEKKHPYQDVHGIDDNSTNTDWVGPIFHDKAQVSFLPMRTEDLMRDEDGHVRKFVQEDSHSQKCRVDTFQVPNGYAGLACDVAPIAGEVNMHRAVFDQLRYHYRSNRA